MPTVLEILQKITDFLARKEVPQPRLEAEWLLAHTLRCQRLDLYLRFDQALDEAQLIPLRENAARRGRREPLQYITGQADFLDFTVACDHRALIPRPETEELAELIFARQPTPPASALDLGTGTGVLALALARRWPECRVTAIDTSEETLALARANAETLGLTQRIRFLHTKWPEGLIDELGNFNVIVSNPPYLTTDEWAAAAPEVRDWEPRQALIADDNGLADLSAILHKAPSCLAQGGLLALETGPEQHAALKDIAAAIQVHGQAAYTHTESVRDLARRDRFFLAWRT